MLNLIRHYFRSVRLLTLTFVLSSCYIIMIIIIIMISIFKEGNVLRMTANLPYGPPMNTDNDYYKTIFPDLFVSDAMLVVQYMLGEEKPVIVL